MATKEDKKSTEDTASSAPSGAGEDLTRLFRGDAPPPEDGSKVKGAKASGEGDDKGAQGPQDAGKAGSGFDPLESPKEEGDKKPVLVTPQSGQPLVAEDPRGDSPRRVNQAGFVTHAQAGVDHPNQPVQPTRYAFQMTEWLALPEAERAKTAPPEPPDGQAPHPLAVQPSQEDVDQGKDLGRKQVVLR